MDEAIRELPEPIRETVVEHYLRQRTQTEIAKELNVNVSTVSRRVQKGLALLRDRLRKRGIGVALGAFAVLLGKNASAALPAPLKTSLLKIGLAGVGPTSAQTATLAQKSVWAMATKPAGVTLAVLVASVAIVGTLAVKTMQGVSTKRPTPLHTTPIAGPQPTPSQPRLELRVTLCRIPKRAIPKQDVVVAFPDTRCRFVFWRGTNYVPCWDLGRAWLTYEWLEAEPYIDIPDLFNAYPHWPVTRGMRTAWLDDPGQFDRPTHSNLINLVNPPIREPPEQKDFLWLIGICNQDQKAIEASRTWLNPGTITEARGLERWEFSQQQKAYICSRKGGTPDLVFTIKPPEDAPIVNPTFVINPWKGSADVTIPNAHTVKIGHEQDTLVVWCRGRFSRPLSVRVEP